MDTLQWWHRQKWKSLAPPTSTCRRQVHWQGCTLLALASFGNREQSAGQGGGRGQGGEGGHFYAYSSFCTSAHWKGQAALCFYVIRICTYFQIQFAISWQGLGQSKSHSVPSTSTLSPPSLVSKSSSPAARKFPIQVSFVPQQLPTHTTLSVSSLDSQFSTFQSKVRKQNSWCTSSVSD